MKLAWYGDDFTGASDTLAVAAQAGLRCMLFLDIPTASRMEQAGALDALGIAGSARTMSPRQMEAELSRVGEFFMGLGAPVMHYKCCSTFDSSAQAGSIGAALSILGARAGCRVAYVVGGQPDIGRYCCFSNLFAAAGADADICRLDRHPTMSMHPVTPMREADLRRHLEAQRLAQVGAVHYPDYGLSEARLDAKVAHIMAGLKDAGEPAALLFDVADAAHLAPVGRQIWQRASCETTLVAGSSTVIQALGAYWNTWTAQPWVTARQAAPLGAAQTMPRTAGPVFALAGSMSPVTARQVEAAGAYQRQPLDAARLVAEPAYLQEQVDRAVQALAAGLHVLAHVRQSGAGPDGGVRTEDLALRTADLLRRVLRAAAGKLVLGRLGVAGGDTSSLAIKALDIWALSFIRALSPGVALCRAHSDDPALDGMPLMLKGGQMGPEDIFLRLLQA